MAKISNKSMNDLSTWDAKELRKLKIMCQNRISALKTNSKSTLKSTSILYDLDLVQLESLIIQILKAERIKL